MRNMFYFMQQRPSSQSEKVKTAPKTRKMNFELTQQQLLKENFVDFVLELHVKVRE